MADGLEEVREVLTKGSEEYRRLRERHRGFEERLDSLNAKAFLSEEEKLETHRLKKEKLQLKDRMTAMARDYLEKSPGVSGR